VRSACRQAGFVGSRVRAPQCIWKCSLVMCFVRSGLCDELIARSEESCRECVCVGGVCLFVCVCVCGWVGGWVGLCVI
jgi:hypothetical protein